MTIIEKRLLPGLVGPLVLAACILSGCDRGATTSETPSPPAAKGAAIPDLAGTVWLLQELGGRNVLDDPKSTLGFRTEGRIAGLGGCNAFSGTATITGDRIAVGPLAGTKMACPPDVMDQEARFLDALGKAERLEVNGGLMYVYSAGLEKPLKLTRSGGPK